MLFGAVGVVLAANGEAARLLKAIEDDSAQEIRVLRAGVAATGRPATGQIFLPFDPETGEAQALYYLTAIALAPANLTPDLPAQDTRRVMILGRDGSAEYAMRNALIESRDLYRDLSRCSSDFSWQTDDNGAFTFVSAKGALGFSAQALNGRRSQDLMNQLAETPFENPFITRTPLENIEIAMHDAKGDTRYCRVDALPVYDKQNQWRGARGVSSDITESKLHQQTLEFMRQRETQVRAIVDATHRSLDTLAAFSEAASILASQADATHCVIMSLDRQHRLRVLGASTAYGDAPNYEKLAHLELRMHQSVIEHDPAPIVFMDCGFHNHLVITSHGGAPNGAIWLRSPENAFLEKPSMAPPGAPALSLAETVASHIGIAIAHDTQMHLLAELSRTDELTKLLNRRAFMEDLYQRHSHLYRSSRKGALLYIDLDNFKPVNDLFGHAAGDQVLKEFANILHGHSRIGDLCARLGGDEFAIWLEDTDEDGAEAKARHLIDEAKLLHERAGISLRTDTPPLGLSIGIAIADPRFAEQLPCLIMRADEVMYQVKRQGKGSMLIAPPTDIPACGNNIDG